MIGTKRIKLDFETCSKVIGIDTMWYWHKDKHIDQQNRVPSLEINPFIYGQMIFDKSAKIHSVGERTVFSTNSAGKLEDLMQRNEVELLPHITYKKINSKSIKDLNIKPKTIKLLEENIGKKLHNVGFSKDFLDVTPASKRKTQTN